MHQFHLTASDAILPTGDDRPAMEPTVINHPDQLSLRLDPVDDDDLPDEPPYHDPVIADIDRTKRHAHLRPIGDIVADIVRRARS